MIGVREVNGERQVFAARKDLVAAGLVNEGMQLVKINRYFDAEKRLRQALFLTPESEQVRFDLAVVLTQIGQPDEARAILSDLRTQQPRRPAYLVALADTLLVLGEPQEARTLLKQAFRSFIDAQNLAQAARVARSIANVDFELGYEQEALCYSYEAYSLAPTAEQLGWHGRLLVAQNLHQTALDLITATLKLAPADGSSAPVQHALALARYAHGDLTGALAAEELALDLVSQSPELGAELNAAWWVMQRERLQAAPVAGEAGAAEDGESGEPPAAEGEAEAVLDPEQRAELEEKLAAMQPEVRDFAQQGGLLLVTWPIALRSALEQATAEVQPEGVDGEPAAFEGKLVEPQNGT
jgi:tetratricopeptide (TPR) repeat protein